MGRESRSRESRREHTYGFFLVAFVDVLGQRDELRALTKLPHNTEAMPEALQILKRTAGRVQKVRHGFESYFNQARHNRQPMPPGSTRKEWNEFYAIRSAKYRLQSFSDTVVISVPLHDNQYGAANAALSAHLALFGIAGMFLHCLALGIPLRVGIDVERGIDFSSNEIYGPALMLAYELEQHTAQYPRAVVGSGVLDYLGWVEALPATEPRADLAKKFAATSRELICSAPDDGKPMLHCLANQIVQTEGIATSVTAAHDFIRVQVERFELMKNEKLSVCYRRALAYFDRYSDTLQPKTT